MIFGVLALAARVDHERVAASKRVMQQRCEIRHAIYSPRNANAAEVRRLPRLSPAAAKTGTIRTASVRRQRRRAAHETGGASITIEFEEIGMNGAPGEPFFTILKALSYVALAAMAGAILYAAAMALRYWPGISV